MLLLSKVASLSITRQLCMLLLASVCPSVHLFVYSPMRLSSCADPHPSNLLRHSMDSRIILPPPSLRVSGSSLATLWPLSGHSLTNLWLQTIVVLQLIDATAEDGHNT